MRKCPRYELYAMMERMTDIFEILPNTREHILDAIHLKASDFEDALQYQAALSAGCDCIITRNAKDFKFSVIPVCSAAEYVDRYFR